MAASEARQLRQPSLSNWGCRENYFNRDCVCAVEYHGIGLCGFLPPAEDSE